MSSFDELEDKYQMTQQDWEFIASLNPIQMRSVERYAAYQIKEGFESLLREDDRRNSLRTDRAVLHRFEGRPVVYLMHHVASGEYKIGYTQSITKRVRAVEGSRSPTFESWSPVIVRGAIIYRLPYLAGEGKQWPSRWEWDNNQIAELLTWESHWHYHFADKRIGRSEWFNLTEDDVAEFIAAMEPHNTQQDDLQTALWEARRAERGY